MAFEWRKACLLRKKMRKSRCYNSLCKGGPQKRNKEKKFGILRIKSELQEGWLKKTGDKCKIDKCYRTRQNTEKLKF